MDGDAIVIGADCKLYRNTGSYGSPTWVEIDIIGTLNHNRSFAEGDISMRASKKKRSYRTQEDTPIDFTTPAVEGDTNYEALLDAYVDGAILDLLIAAGARTVSGHSWHRDRFQIFNKSEPQNVDGVVQVSWTLKPSFTTNEATDGTTTTIT